MTIIVGCVGQKGGPGKSTLARLLAVGVIRAGMAAAIADLDHTQKTILDWAAKREKLRASLTDKVKLPKTGMPPRVPCQVYSDVDAALADASAYNFYILDAPGRTGPEIMRIAQASDIVVLPCSPSGDDINPTIRVFNSLVQKGVPRSKLIVVLNHIGGAPEETAARDFLTQCGAQVLDLGLREKVVYRSAMTAGLSAAEVTGDALRGEAEAVVKALMALIIKVHNDERTGGHGEDGGASGEKAA